MFLINKLNKIKYILSVIIFLSVFPTVASSEDQIELDFMVFETPNLPAEFWDDAIARTIKDFP